MLRRWWRALGDRVDASLVRGQLWFVVLLGAAAVAVAFLAAVVVTALRIDVGRGEPRFGQAMREAFAHTIDPGQFGDDRGPGALTMLAVTLVGLVLVSSLIALMTNKVEQRVDNANRGRSPVPLEDHYVVLGWTDLTLKVLEQLSESAGPGRPPPTMVLGEGSLTAMRQRIDERRRDLRAQHGRGDGGPAPWPKNWPRLRTGDPADKRDLDRIARLHRARSVIVLSPDPDGPSATGAAHSPDRAARREEATARLVETVLAINAELSDRAALEARQDVPPEARHREPVVVVEFAHDGPTAELLRRRVGARGGQLLTVDSANLQANLAAHVSRRPGLATVYESLLSFTGAEFHVVPVPAGVGSFGEAVARLERACAVGVVRPLAPGAADEHVSAPDRVDLWPQWDDPLAPGTQLVVLADHDEAGPVDPTQAGVAGPRPTLGIVARSGRVLVLGWNAGVRKLIDSVRGDLEQPPEVTVVTEHDVATQLAEWWPEGGVDHVHPTGGVQAWLDDDANRVGYDHAIILSDHAKAPSVADAETLLAYLALRPPGVHEHYPETAVAELQQRSAKHLVARNEGNDLIAGRSLTADVLAQSAVSPRIASVLEQLLGDSAIEVDLVGPDRYELPERFDVRALVRAVAERGEIALGYRLRPPGGGDAHDDDPVVVLDPSRTSSTELPRNELVDVIVLARGCGPGDVPVEVADAAEATPAG